MTTFIPRVLGMAILLTYIVNTARNNFPFVRKYSFSFNGHFVGASSFSSRTVHPHKQSDASTSHKSENWYSNGCTSPNSTITSNLSPSCSTTRYKYKVIQVQIIHRHGDRTPITPMKDEDYWRQTLPSPHVLEKMAAGTTILRDENVSTNHAGAGGRGPFGKLTNLGLFQMVQVGTRLLDELHATEESDHQDNHHHPAHHVDEEGHVHIHKGRLFTPTNPIHPSKIKVTSTDFPRTLQSVQALLVGLFPDGIPSYTSGSDSNSTIDVVQIDARHTDIMIPDPKPRRSVEQAELEKFLASRSHLVEKEAEMVNFAVRLTEALKDILAEDAFTLSFGIAENSDEDGNDVSAAKKTKPLSWAQLAEITTCLRSRNILPPSISEEDHEAITQYTAWKWFENLRDERLAQLAMGDFLNRIIHSLKRGRHYLGDISCDDEEKQQETTVQGEEDEPWLHIYSGHDSMLIGLLCVFRLEQPAKWPEYGSFLKIELIEQEIIMKEEQEYTGRNKNHFVRFSLNGEILRSKWGLGKNGYLEPQEMVSLDHLIESINLEHYRS